MFNIRISNIMIERLNIMNLTDFCIKKCYDVILKIENKESCIMPNTILHTHVTLKISKTFYITTYK